MSIIDQAKNAASSAVSNAKDKTLGADVFAKMIIKQTHKQERINEILASEESNYRIGNIEIEVGIPPKIVYVIEKLPGD